MGLTWTDSSGVNFDPAQGLWEECAAFFASVMKETRRAATERRLSLGQFMVLRTLYRKGEVPTTFWRDHLGISPSASSELVDGLAEAGYLVRKEDRSDRRVRLISLSTAGRQLMTEIEAHQALRWRNRCQSVPSMDLEMARRVLQQLRESETEGAIAATRPAHRRQVLRTPPTQAKRVRSRRAR